MEQPCTIIFRKPSTPKRACLALCLQLPTKWLSLSFQLKMIICLFFPHIWNGTERDIREAVSWGPSILTTSNLVIVSICYIWPNTANMTWCCINSTVPAQVYSVFWPFLYKVYYINVNSFNSYTRLNRFIVSYHKWQNHYGYESGFVRRPGLACNVLCESNKPRLCQITSNQITFVL